MPIFDMPLSGLALDVYEEYYPNEQIKIRYTHYPYRGYTGKDGTYTEWYENGKVRVQGEYEHIIYSLSDEQKIGTWTGWHENGEKQWQEYGEEDGIFTSKKWYENGQMMEQKKWKWGDAYGTWTGWYESGEIKWEIGDRYEADGHSYFTHWMWYKSGNIWREHKYKDHNINGLFKEWYENGQLWEQEEYRDGIKHGTSIWWHSHGRKTREGHYVDGKKHGTWTTWRHDNGRKTTRRTLCRWKKAWYMDDLVYRGAFRIRWSL